MDVHTKNYTLCAVEPILGQEENILAQLQVAPSHTFVLDFIKKLKQQLGVTDKELLLPAALQIWIPGRRFRTRR